MFKKSLQPVEYHVPKQMPAARIGQYSSLKSICTLRGGGEEILQQGCIHSLFMCHG